MLRFSFGEMFLGAYLRWTGKRHLLPLLRSLKHAGRPSEVAFPDELVEQGLSLVLAGLNNTVAVQSNPSWVWPYWAERQIDPDSPAFLPTGTGVIKHNLTARNWVALGCVGSAREAMVDPVGMITLRPYGWSWFPYLRIDGATFLPPRMTGVRQELVEGTLPALHTLYATRPGLEWSSESLAVRDDGGTEWLLCTHALRNASDHPVTLDFGIALRPYNPLMFSPIGAIRHEGGLFRVNGKAALLLPEVPDQVVFSNRSRGDSLVHPEFRGDGESIVSLSGVVSAAAEFRWTLAPGETRALPTAGVIARGSVIGNGRMRLPGKDEFAMLRTQALRRMRNAEAEGMTIRIPHAGLERAFRAVKGRLHVFDDGDRFSPGSFLYHGHWFRDAAFIALACDQVGFGARVASKVAATLKRQSRDGFFRSQNGEWDSNGQALWTLVGHVRRGGDPALLRTAWPALMHGARWIDRMRRKTRRTGPARRAPHFGLMPAGFSAEHFGPNDHYYWDAFWSLAGLESLLWAARLLGEVRDAERLAKWIDELRTDIDASTQDAFRRTGGEGLPCSPYRGMDSAAVGVLVALSPLGVSRPDAEWVAGTVEFLARNNLRDGLFLQKIIHTGLNPYLSAQLARALLLRQDARAFGILESLLRHGGPAHAWPEAIHPRTGGGCMGDGDHGWAASEFLSLLRDCLLREEHGREEQGRGQGDRLLLLSGAPEGWFRAGNVLEVNGAPTLHGTLSFRVEVQALSLAVEWKVGRAAHQDPAGATLCLPLYFARAREIAGAAWGPHLRIDLPGDSGRLVFDTPPLSNHEANREKNPIDGHEDGRPSGRYAHA
ncbi:MAG TPA: hypothetical protein VHO02_06340 [Fibrobacteria bacterium]|nr:hypothetical protein [Fibrobacteria bacterium]